MRFYFLNIDSLDKLTITKTVKKDFEFDIQIVEVDHSFNIEMNKWLALRSSIEKAMIEEDDLVLFSIGSLAISEFFTLKSLLSQLSNSLKKGVDLLIGNVIEFGQAVPLSSTLFWIDHFFGSSMMVFFKPAFKKIMNVTFKKNDSFDIKIFESLNRKILIYPFISNITPTIVNSTSPEKQVELSQCTVAKLEMYKSSYSHFILLKEEIQSLKDRKKEYEDVYSRYIVLREQFISNLSRSSFFKS
ncbi:hypothetical protein RYH73_25765 [Olivibacter sp. CPCC 100613]|uniref:hypothetical protein n=1 Tax=Olivibacter sp. CPCC 100613 TaxID=3079931 RepID=UPI002FFBE218